MSDEWDAMAATLDALPAARLTGVLAEALGRDFPIGEVARMLAKPNLRDLMYVERLRNVLAVEPCGALVWTDRGPLPCPYRIGHPGGHLWDME